MSHLFIHVPKTAGTSLRKSVEESFGAGSACYDYGVLSPETSESVRSFVYDNEDFNSFYKNFTEQGFQFLSGHFPAAKYLKYFPLKNTFALVRDPLQRVASEYAHFKRHHSYGGSFKDFYTDPRFINRQVKLLGATTWQLLGFVGLSEKYKDSISLINYYFDWGLNYLELNKHSDEPGICHEISDEDVKAITSLNFKDIKLYEAVSNQFSQRLYAMAQKEPFFNGSISGLEAGILKGWVMPEAEDSSVDVVVTVNGTYLYEVKAKEYHVLLSKYNSGRLGHVGFTCKVNNLSLSDVVEVKVAQTEQPLLNSPLIITQQHLSGILKG